MDRAESAIKVAHSFSKSPLILSSPGTGMRAASSFFCRLLSVEAYGVSHAYFLRLRVTEANESALKKGLSVWLCEALERYHNIREHGLDGVRDVVAD